MESTSTECKDAKDGQQRPKRNLEDQMVSTYLEGRSEIYRDLMKVQDDGWNNPQADAYFQRQRHTADNATWNECKAFFNMMCKIGDEMHAKSGGTLTLPRSNARVLDLCMAPGGYTASVLKRSPHAVVCAFTLPRQMGGHIVMLGEDPRVHTEVGDITMLHKEFGVEEIPHDHCEISKFDKRRLWDGQKFDLVFCDGNALRTHKMADSRRQVEANRLKISQLILAMERVESGGTLIMLLHSSAAYRSLKLLHLFDNIAELQLFKPTAYHAKRGSFYLIAKNVQPAHSEAVAAIREWKRVWKELTFPTLDENKQRKPPKAANESKSAEEVSDLLKTFGQRIIELGEPLWQIQKEGLATTVWTKKKKQKTGSERIRTGKASTTAIDHAAAASSKDQGEKGDKNDDVDAATALGTDSEPTASDPAKLAEAMGKMGVHD